MRSLECLKDVRPATEDHLWHWVRAFTGVSVARAKVCRDHSPPFDFLASSVLDRPPMALVLGPRGGGKSFLSAIGTHLDSRHHAGHRTRILGGSKSQSAQIFEALEKSIVRGQGPGGSDGAAVAELLRESARYRNGSEVSILAASSKSVRGPHVASLKLDEVDEIDSELRQAAMGMCMADGGSSASVLMTSTWHRVGGPMAELLATGRAGAFPVFSFCVFDVVERCPEERSGPELEKCPVCPLVAWCHAERDRNGGVPLAKLADGHYSIDALIQKVHGVSVRIFEADYLCRGPKADGLWFKRFDASDERVVSLGFDYDPALPVVLAIDSGVFTGAVAFQCRPAADGGPPDVTVFWDYLAEALTAQEVARAIVDGLGGRRGPRLKVVTDPAGGSRNAVGPTVLSEYEAAGLKAEPWPLGSIADGLALVEGLLLPAAGPPRLHFHGRCTHLVQALQAYRRARRAGQWQDYPEDPQHPAEDLVDALRGGLRSEFPDGLVAKPQPTVVYRNVHRVLY